MEPSKKERNSFEQAKGELRLKPSTAVLKLNTLIEANPYYAAPYTILVKYYEQKRNWDEADKLKLKAAEHCPNQFAEFYLELAKYAIEQKKFDNAGDLLEVYLSDNIDYQASYDEAIVLKTKMDNIQRIMENPVPFDPKKLSGINTEYDEYLPMLSPDNQFMFFTRHSKQKNSFSVIGGESWVEQFMQAAKVEEHKYEIGSPMESPFNQGFNEGGASLSLDNKTIIVTICRAPDGFGSCDLYSANFDGNAWGPLTNLGPTINDSSWQSQVSLNAVGNRIYFSSDMEGGFGGKDIWCSELDSNKTWQQPINLGSKINTEKDEKSPFIHTDNQTLYFSSQGHNNLGGFDIFISRLDSLEQWSAATNIGYPINSFNDDLGFFASLDGKIGYFASKERDKAKGWEIYEFELTENVQPRKIIIVKGKLVDENGAPLDKASLEFINLKTEQSEQIEVAANGEFIFNKTIDEDQMLFANQEGYFFDAIKIDSDYHENDPIISSLKLEKLSTNATFTIDDINFGTDSYQIPKNAYENLNNLARYLAKNPKVKINIAGHTDDIGDDAKNLVLSKNRAKAVLNYITQKNIAANRLSADGYGETKPIASNDTENGRLANRRTEIKIEQF